MTEWGDGEKRLRGEPPVPPEPFDPSTREFPAVRPEEVSDPGRPLVAPGGDAEPEGIEDDLRVREAERIERR
ncbi:MAG: hypothetical protein ACM31K_02260, partial [Solirubrobacterales bacterium]